MKSLTAGFLATALRFGQAAPQFEVVSIKPNTSSDRGGGMRPIAGGFSARNLSLKMLIQSTYKVKPWQITGGPGWAASDRYDIEAKAEGNPTFQQKLEMLSQCSRTASS